MNEIEFKKEKSKRRNCLILEDNPSRFNYLINLAFQICYPYIDKLIIVTIAKDAIEELNKTKEFNLIMLDHDLDGKVYTNSENFNNGYQVCKFIKENNIKYGLCIIHTLNEYAAPKMLDMLKDTGQVIYKPCVDL